MLLARQNRSYTTGRAPASLRAIAVARPHGPAPMTATDVVLGAPTRAMTPPCTTARIRATPLDVRSTSQFDDLIAARADAHELVRELPWAVWAAEVADHTILEYLLPLVALYRRLANKAGRVLTGYGADIPLGGMHRLTERLGSLDELISHDMATFDGLNEMSPTLSGIAGVWSTHPYWDREVLSLLVTLEPGLKRRHGRDKWVLRESLAHLLPAATVARPKLGIHEGSGLASTWSRELTMRGVPAGRVTQVKSGMARRLHTQLVLEGMHPSDTSFDEALASTLTDQRGSQP